jgi:serine/threonine protein kinase
MVGQMLSHYRILEQIGAGGMGVVYRAHDERLERDVAIKVLPVGTLADESARRRFRKEALTLSKLSHPNIATVHDFDSQDGVDFLVTEYVSGVTLDAKLAGAGLPEKEVIRLGTQLSEGLDAAHQQDIVHRDLKPANLRLTPDGRLKILDFGLAQLMPHASDLGLTATLTQSQEVTGTLPYMAPEQLRGGVADTRCDIWAAGAVLYEMATAHRPFEEKVPTALADDIIHKTPLSPRSLKSTLSPKLAAVILKCLEKEPAQRYQSARELQADLERLSTGASPLAARRRLWPVIAASAIVVVSLAVGAFFYLHRSPQLTEKDTIVLADFANTTGDAVFDDTLKQALAVQLEQSPFLNVLSDQKVNATLRLMDRSPSDRLTENVARELCQRAGSKAMLAGSIDSLGRQYVIGLKALNCTSGDSLAREQVQAAAKEEVLKALSTAARNIRGKLGEALATIQQFDTPVEQATTPSLEALKAYSLGLKTWNMKGDTAGLPFFRRAVELDPEFAMAYARMGGVYGDLGEPTLSAENMRRAFELREKVSERERLYI